MGTGQTYTTLIIEAAIWYGHRNVFKHEWGHSILEYFEAAGAAPKPKVENHAYASQYVHCPTGEAYVWEDETEANPIPNSIYNNQSGFTHDYYSGTTATADQPTRCLGITPEAWASGGPVSKPDPGFSPSWAVGINNHGQVVGTARTPAGDEHAFQWSAGQDVTDLGTLGGDGSWSWAAGINDRGQIVGTSRASGSDEHAVLWTAEHRITDLGTLGGDYSQGTGINNRGQIVGESQTAANDDHAFIWSAKTGMVDLGTLGGSYSRAFGINNHGQVVGVSQTNTGVEHAFIWDAKHGMVDLGALGSANSRAYDINDRGEVVGESQYRAVVWTHEPVPESR